MPLSPDTKSQQRGSITGILLNVDTPSAHAAGEPRPLRWRTFLYYFLFVTCFVVAFPWMVYVPVEDSSGSGVYVSAHHKFLPIQDAFSSETLPNYA